MENIIAVWTPEREEWHRADRCWLLVFRPELSTPPWRDLTLYETLISASWSGEPRIYRAEDRPYRSYGKGFQFVWNGKLLPNTENALRLKIGYPEAYDWLLQILPTIPDEVWKAAPIQWEMGD